MILDNADDTAPRQSKKEWVVWYTDNSHPDVSFNDYTTAHTFYKHEFEKERKVEIMSHIF